jgi:hypothetical protein
MLKSTTVEICGQKDFDSKIRIEGHELELIDAADEGSALQHLKLEVKLFTTEYKA